MTFFCGFLRLLFSQLISDNFFLTRKIWKVLRWPLMLIWRLVESSTLSGAWLQVSGMDKTSSQFFDNILFRHDSQLNIWKPSYRLLYVIRALDFLINFVFNQWRPTCLILVLATSSFLWTIQLTSALPC